MKRILIASDNAVFRQVLFCSLSDLGAEIDTAASEDEFVRRAVSTPYNVIVTRFASPLLGGEDLARRLHRRSVRPAIFFVSRLGREEMLLSLFESGIDQFISLPLSSARLKRKVRDELKKADDE